MIETYELNSIKLTRMCKIHVVLPKHYTESTIDYPVLYMHDAQNLFADEASISGSSWGILDCIDKSGKDIILVGIESNTVGSKRFDEFSPWVCPKSVHERLGLDYSIGGEGDHYVEFITKELKPFIDTSYRTIIHDTAMAGSSAGGLISTYAMCKYPSIYQRVAALSNAYWLNQKEIEEFAEKSDLSTIKRFYFDVGTNEQTESFSPSNYIHSNLSFKHVMDKKGIPYQFAMIDGALHNEAAWKERFPSIFTYLYEEKD